MQLFTSEYGKTADPFPEEGYALKKAFFQSFEGGTGYSQEIKLKNAFSYAYGLNYHQ